MGGFRSSGSAQIVCDPVRKDFGTKYIFTGTGIYILEPVLWIRDILVRIREAQKHNESWSTTLHRKKLKKKDEFKKFNWRVRNKVKCDIWICVGTGADLKHCQGTITVATRYVTIRILPLIL